MSRLIDDIRRIGRTDPPWFIDSSQLWKWDEHARRIFRIIQDRQLPVLLVDNVAKYYWEASGQEYWDLTRDFPNIAPPYPAFWVEFKFPKKIHSDVKGDRDMSAIAPNGRTGMLFLGVPRADVQGEHIPIEAKWIMAVELYLDYGIAKNRVDGPPGTILTAIDEHGRVIDAPRMQSLAGPEHDELMKHMMTWLHPALLAISFLHCKNVTVVDNVVPPKLAKKYARHHGFEPTNYKTLVIEPLKEILRTEGRSGEVGVAKALHICRGHFKDYREGKGLFGKFHMLVWHESTVRGTRGDKVPAREIEVKV